MSRKMPTKRSKTLSKNHQYSSTSARVDQERTKEMRPRMGLAFTIAAWSTSNIQKWGTPGGRGSTLRSGRNFRPSSLANSVTTSMSADCFCRDFSGMTTRYTSSSGNVCWQPTLCQELTWRTVSVLRQKKKSITFMPVTSFLFQTINSRKSKERERDDLSLSASELEKHNLGWLLRCKRLSPGGNPSTSD